MYRGVEYTLVLCDQVGDRVHVTDNVGNDLFVAEEHFARIDAVVGRVGSPVRRVEAVVGAMPPSLHAPEEARAVTRASARANERVRQRIEQRRRERLAEGRAAVADDVVSK